MREPLIAVFDAVAAFRRKGESWFDCAERMAIEEMLHRTGGRQDNAAVLLHVSRRELNYKIGKHGMRPKDALRLVNEEAS